MIIIPIAYFCDHRSIQEYKYHWSLLGLCDITGIQTVKKKKLSSLNVVLHKSGEYRKELLY